MAAFKPGGEKPKCLHRILKTEFPLPEAAHGRLFRRQEDMRSRIRSILAAITVTCGTLVLASCGHTPGIVWSQTRLENQRPSYQIDAMIDYDLLTFKGSALVTVPASAGDSLSDVAFFLYANAAGIVDDERRKYIVVDHVLLHDEAVPFTLKGAILHVSLVAPAAWSFQV